MSNAGSQATTKVPGGTMHRHAGTILKMIRDGVAVKLELLFDGLSENVADALFEEMIGLDEEQALTSHFNVMRAMRNQMGDLQDAYQQQLADSWIAIAREESLDNDIPAGIVADSVAIFEKKVRNHYKVLIQDVNLRLSTLLGRKVTAMPLQPIHLHAIFWRAIQHLELEPEERVLLIPLFHRFVMDRYGQLLAIANRVLMEHDIEPVSITERPRRRR